MSKLNESGLVFLTIKTQWREREWFGRELRKRAQRGASIATLKELANLVQNPKYLASVTYLLRT